MLGFTSGFALQVALRLATAPAMRDKCCGYMGLLAMLHEGVSLAKAREPEPAPGPEPEALRPEGVEQTLIVTLTLEGKGNPGVSFKDVWPRVASVAPGGLAHAAGVRAGHVCLTVGDDAAGSFSDARDALAGRGRPLSLTFAAGTREDAGADHEAITLFTEDAVAARAIVAERVAQVVKEDLQSVDAPRQILALRLLSCHSSGAPWPTAISALSPIE